MGRDMEGFITAPVDVYQEYKDNVYAAHARGTINGLLDGVIAANDTLVQRIAPDEATYDNPFVLPPLVQTLVDMNIAQSDTSTMDKYQEHKHNVFKAAVSGDKDDIIAKAVAADVTLLFRFAENSVEQARNPKKIVPTKLYQNEKTAHPLIQRHAIEFDFFQFYLDMTYNSDKYQRVGGKEISFSRDMMGGDMLADQKAYLKTLSDDKKLNYYPS